MNYTELVSTKARNFKRGKVPRFKPVGILVMVPSLLHFPIIIASPKLEVVRSSSYSLYQLLIEIEISEAKRQDHSMATGSESD